MDIDAIRATVLDARTKGIPGTAAPFALSDIAAQGWNVLRQDMPLPLMVLKRGNLEYNADLFASYLKGHNLSLAPHGKTTMAPQVFSQQLDDGAWGITAATVNQVQLIRHYGIKRIVLANQLVGRAHLATIAAAINEDADFEFYCFVDSLAQLRNMTANLQGLALARPIRLLVEIGAMGGRAGVREQAAALELVRAITKQPELFCFHGLATFEGAIAGLDQSSAPVAHLATRILEIARALPAETYADLDEFILSGGGSAYFDMIADRFSTLELPIPVRVLLRSGCYVTNDHGSYRDAQEAARCDPDRHWHQEFRPALEVWSYVQSMPETGLAFLTMGKRDVPYDAGLPVPFKRYRPDVGFLDVGTCEVFATNDQHAFVRLDDDTDWQVGDMICSGISHPCTAFDKWRFIPVVNDDYDVVDGVLTFF